MVLHAGVGNLNELVSVEVEGVFAEVVLVGVEHLGDLLKLRLGFVQVFREGVEIERGGAVRGCGEVLVVADVERDVVVVDRVVHVPTPLGVAVAEVLGAFEAAVGDVGQVVGDGHVDLHAVLGLVAPLILVGPPGTGALFLAGCRNPGLPGLVLVEAETAEAALLDWMARVGEVDRVSLALVESFGKVHVDRSLFAGIR